MCVGVLVNLVFSLGSIVVKFSNFCRETISWQFSFFDFFRNWNVEYQINVTLIKNTKQFDFWNMLMIWDNNDIIQLFFRGNYPAGIYLFKVTDGNNSVKSVQS